jgi:hypothetical protein
VNPLLRHTLAHEHSHIVAAALYLVTVRPSTWAAMECYVEANDRGYGRCILRGGDVFALDEARRYSSMGPLGLTDDVDAIVVGFADESVYRECSPSDMEDVSTFSEIEQLRAALSVHTYVNLLGPRLDRILGVLDKLGDDTTFVPMRKAVDVDLICEAKRVSNAAWPQYHVRLLRFRREAARALARTV